MIGHRRLKKRVKKHYLKLLVVCVVLAFMLWVLIKLSHVYQKDVTLEVIPRHFPETLRLSLEDTTVLKGTLKMAGYYWIQYAFQPVSVYIDFEDVQPKEALYVWNSDTSFFKINAQLPSYMHLLHIKTKQLKFRYVVLKQKYVPVKSNITLHFNKGYGVLDTLTMAPHTVKVIGNEAFLSQLNYIETQPITLKNLEAPFTTKVKLQTAHFKTHATVNVDEIHVKVPVEKFTEGIMDVPIIFLNIPKGKEVKHFPKKVSVSYNTTLDSYNTISAADFEVVCDYNKVDNTHSFLIPELKKHPKRVSNVRLHQQKIEFILTD